MIRITIASSSFLLLATLAPSCSPKPPPVQSVKELRSDEVKKALPLPTTRPILVDGVSGGQKDDKASKEEEVNPLQTQVFNQLLARSDENIDVDELRRQIEASTGAKVEKIRKGALGLLQIRFAVVNPPRDAAAQKALVEKVKNLDGLKSVEAERLMFPRENEPSK